ncbi:hypothetical protein E4K10_45945 [Streptomyces sp. T1317-0309]|nr:hypothetical protein E4K10_45945 [Streptomyces sp. T1317-0309]
MTDAIHQGLVIRELTPGEHDVDADYVTGARIVTAHMEHSIELLGPLGLDICHERHGAEDFAQSAFAIDWQVRKVTCPQGVTTPAGHALRKPAAPPSPGALRGAGLRPVPLATAAPRLRTANGAAG